MAGTSPTRVPVLYDYFRTTAKVLQADYERSKGLKAPADLGTVREGFVNDFLKKVLPRSFSVESGEILDSYDHRTGQLDTVVLRDDVPRLTYGGEKVSAFVVEGVFSAVETKSRLDAERFRQAVTTLTHVADLRPQNFTGITFGPTIDRPIRAVFAYEGASLGSLTDGDEHLEDRKVVDAICVLDQATLIRCDLVKQLGMIVPPEVGETDYIGYRTSALGLAAFYHLLTAFASSFAGRSVNLSNYLAGKWPQ